MGPETERFSDSPDPRENPPASGPVEPAGTHDLFPAVYHELRALAHAKMAREPAGHTLQTTALVNEVYVRLSAGGAVKWENPRQFFAAAAEAMRRILVERARKQAAIKHGGGRKRSDLQFVDAAIQASQPLAMLALDEAMDELRTFDSWLCEIVMLRYFTGLSVEETAAALDSSPRSIKRDWAVARAWLARKLGATE